MTRGMILAVLSTAILLAGAPASRADSTDALLARVDQFQLDDHETRTLRRRAAVQGYRVCMEAGRHAVPLKVTYDDQVAIIAPGECQLIEAGKIKLASAERLPAGVTLIGSFDRGRNSRQYSTDVSVARTASAE